MIQNKDRYHAFSVQVANECGIYAALAYQSLVYWEEQAVMRGEEWVYVTLAKLAVVYPYVSKHTMARGLKSLVELGMVEEHPENQNGRPMRYRVADGRPLQSEKVGARPLQSEKVPTYTLKSIYIYIYNNITIKGGVKKLKVEGDYVLVNDPIYQQLKPVEVRVEKLTSREVQAFCDWLEHRKAMKKKLAVTTVVAQLDFLLENIPAGMITECIGQSIRNGWTGLYEIKKAGGKGHWSSGEMKSIPKSMKGGAV